MIVADTLDPGRPDATASSPSFSSRISLVARIAALEAELQQVRQALRDEDDGRFLRAVAIGAGGCVFSVGDLFTRAALDPDLAAALHGWTPKRLGKCLARLVGHDLHGLTVRRVLVTNAGWLWEIHFHQDAVLSG